MSWTRRCKREVFHIPSLGAKRVWHRAGTWDSNRRMPRDPRTWALDVLDRARERILSAEPESREEVLVLLAAGLNKLDRALAGPGLVPVPAEHVASLRSVSLPH